MSVPRKVISVSKNTAVLSDGRKARLDLVGTVKPGSFVLVNADMVIEKISKKQAEEMGALLHEAG
jgi:hydrogenase maturation factor